ncbi:hypothetical protein TDB9533_03416 [Thalassocella blandensis]|nr:hypothetical protein TDB9533_03416 [Thalassocella blandensis]
MEERGILMFAIGFNHHSLRSIARNSVVLLLFVSSGAFSLSSSSSSSSSSSGSGASCDLQGDPLENVSCANSAYWNNAAFYDENAQVQFENSLYRAKWPNSGLNPSEDWGAWEKISACNWMCHPLENFPPLTECGPSVSRRWQSDGLYPPGVHIWQDEKRYVSISCSAGHDPVTSPEQWQYLGDCRMVPPPASSTSSASSSGSSSSGGFGTSNASFNPSVNASSHSYASANSSASSSSGNGNQATSSSSSGFPYISQRQVTYVNSPAVALVGQRIGFSASFSGWGPYPGRPSLPDLVSPNGFASFYVSEWNYFYNDDTFISGGTGRASVFTEPGFYRYAGARLWQFVEVLDPLTCSAEPNACTGLPVWQASQVYTAGDEVIYQQNKYVAKWWTQNQLPPANTQEWGPWLEESCMSQE